MGVGAGLAQEEIHTGSPDSYAAQRRGEIILLQMQKNRAAAVFFNRFIINAQLDENIVKPVLTP